MTNKMKSLFKLPRLGLSQFALYLGIVALAFQITEYIEIGNKDYSAPSNISNEYGELIPNQANIKTFEYIKSYAKELHIKRGFDLDDKLANIVFDKYLDKLDPSHTLLLDSDYKSLLSFKNKLNDDPNTPLSFAYSSYSLIEKRREEKLAHLKSFLQKITENDIDKSLTFEKRDKNSARFASSEEANKYSELVQKYRIAYLMAEGSDFDSSLSETKTLIDNRIKYFFRANNYDVFSTFINTILYNYEPHTYYLEPVRSQGFVEELNNKMSGIGAVVGIDDYYVVIRKLLEGGPAHSTGELRSGDRIVSISQGDGWTNATGLRLQNVTEMIKGPKGTKVILRIAKKGDPISKTKDVVIVRDDIKISTTVNDDSLIYKSKHYKTKNNIGVIKIPSFYSGVSEDVLAKVKKMSAEGVNGISIDLRDNGGGSLQEAQKMASIFLKGGNVTYTRNYEKDETIYADLESDFEFRGPLSVLINRNSASASEIVAGALKDHNRALIIGEPSSGKGTVQSLFDLDFRSTADANLFGSVAITHSKFFRPSGISTQNVGVKPHVDFFEYDASLWGESTYASALPSETLGHISSSFKANNNESINYTNLNKIKDNLIAHDSNLQFYKKENKPKKISGKVKHKFTLNVDKIKKDIAKDDLESLEIVNNERKKESLPLLLDLESIEAEKYLESLDILIGPMMMVFDEYINESERVDERF